MTGRLRNLSPEAVACQIDLFCTPQVMIIERTPTAHSGGSARGVSPAAPPIRTHSVADVKPNPRNIPAELGASRDLVGACGMQMDRSDPALARVPVGAGVS
jgi:hypothetical protein